jgi:hypothetical protein
VTEKLSGGAAFPTPGLNYRNPVDDQGSAMTLRDYFAAKALQGMLSSEAYMREIDAAAENFRDDDGKPADALQKKKAQIKVVTRTAYDLADGMLKARQA